MWRKKWIRFLDTYDTKPHKRIELLKIESAIFENILPRVEAEMGPWCGSKAQNKMADENIASDIYISFKSYERGLKYNGTFFLFNRN